MTPRPYNRLSDSFCSSLTKGVKHWGVLFLSSILSLLNLELSPSTWWRGLNWARIHKVARESISRIVVIIVNMQWVRNILIARRRDGAYFMLVPAVTGFGVSCWPGWLSQHFTSCSLCCSLCWFFKYCFMSSAC